MFGLREVYRPRIVGSIPAVVVRVGAVTVEGTDLGDFYKDDFENLWKYETKSSVPSGQIRASTDQYGGVSTPWFERPVTGLTTFGAGDHDEVNAWIDSHAASLAVAHAVSDSGGGGSTDGGGGITSRPPKSPSKTTPAKSTYSLTPDSGTPTTDSGPSAEASASSSAGGNSSAFIILGMLGVGLIIWKLVG